MSTEHNQAFNSSSLSFSTTPGFGCSLTISLVVFCLDYYNYFSTQLQRRCASKDKVLSKMMSRSNIAEVRMKDEEKKEMLGIGVAYTRAAEISGKKICIFIVC